MTSGNYKRAFNDAQAQLVRAIQERDRMSLEIIRLQRLTSSLAVIANQSEKYEEMQKGIAAEISFIDTIHAIIRSADRPLNRLDVRDRLASYGYDLSVYANGMGFVHTSLNRLVKSGRIAEIRPGVFAPNHFWEAMLNA
jgi:hypothetical protein